ncbi:hypothetical protein [Paludibacter jiangxiensis]|nr:hypothetical protein [Paludibacter jiangxiensis]
MIKQRNRIRILIASLLLMLTTGTLMVKSVHCVLISHDVVTEAVNGQTTVSTDQPDSCPICSFDFYPVILHSLKVLPDVTRFAYSERLYSLIDAPVKQATHLFLLRAPPAA